MRLDMEFKQQVDCLTQTIKEKYKPQKIILYGSVAKNKATKDSDIDIFIIKRTHKKLLDRIKDVFDIVDCQIPIEPIIYTPSEVKKRLKMGDFFIKDILKEGKVLYEKR
ncbi:MAG: nucleotidyltransferase domain-containing protein [Candidatus Omnitrophota bacterium]